MDGLRRPSLPVRVHIARIRPLMGPRQFPMFYLDEEEDSIWNLERARRREFMGEENSFGRGFIPCYHLLCEEMNPLWAQGIHSVEDSFPRTAGDDNQQRRLAAMLRHDMDQLSQQAFRKRLCPQG